VVPAVATTATGVPPVRSMVASVSGRIRRWESTDTGRTACSPMPSAAHARATEKCASSEQNTTGSGSAATPSDRTSRPSRAAAASLASSSAVRLDSVPPGVNTPSASASNPASRASAATTHRSTARAAGPES
jgi:hypothetical protein